MTPLKLSICIATLNRANYIGATLDSIVSQLVDEIEIVIVDGASTDNTPEIVESYQKSFPQIRYHRLASKGGVDRDYDKAVQFAQGEYCWLMTDDDLFKPGAVVRVLDACRKNYSLIIVNAEVRDADISELIEPSRLQVPADRVYESAEIQRLFAETAKYLTFIGGVVIRRELWNDREKERYFGTEFIHVGVIFQATLPGDALVIAQPLIKIRYGNALWTSRSFKIWMFQWPDLVWSFSGFSDATKRRVCAPTPWKRLSALLVERAKGNFSLTEYRTFIRPRPLEFWRRWLIWLIAVAPGWMVNGLALVYFPLFRRQEALEPRDFRASRFYYRHYLRI